MGATTLRREEGAGLALAAAAHIALVAFLVWRPLGKPVVLPPERMTVTISDEVGLTSTSPEPAAQAAPDLAPDLGEPAPAEPEPAPPVPQPRPEPPKPAPPKPQPKPVAKPVVRPMPPPPAPRPVAKPTPPRPIPKAAPAPRPAPPKVQPRPQPPRPAVKAATRSPASPQPRPAGASRIGSDFLKGTPGAQNTGTSRNPPAAAAGPQVRVALSQAVLRKVRPNWQGHVPQGVNTEKLVTILSIELNRDGTLARTPRVIGQEGIDDSNRTQAGRHAEEAIRAVQLSQPFDLPDDLYDAWKSLPPLRFRKST